MPGLSMAKEMRMKMVLDMVKAYDEAMKAEGVTEAQREAVRHRIIWGSPAPQEKAPWEH